MCLSTTPVQSKNHGQSKEPILLDHFCKGNFHKGPNMWTVPLCFYIKTSQQPVRRLRTFLSRNLRVIAVRKKTDTEKKDFVQ